MTAADRPVFLIIGGPNGSGKSSSYKNADVESPGSSAWIINPDLLAARIREVEQLGSTEANLEAVKRIEAWLEASIKSHQTVGVETVLSTPKYRRLVHLAKSLHFEVWLLYVVVSSPQINIERVRFRVTKGGHSVPEDKIVERYTRPLEQFPWFLESADRAWIYDNSGNEPALIGIKQDGVVTLDEDALPAIVQAVRTIQTA